MRFREERWSLQNEDGGSNRRMRLPFAKISAQKERGPSGKEESRPSCVKNDPDAEKDATRLKIGPSSRSSARASEKIRPDRI
jgi:hypothetical protein